MRWTRERCDLVWLLKRLEPGLRWSPTQDLPVTIRTEARRVGRINA